MLHGCAAEVAPAPTCPILYLSVYFGCNKAVKYQTIDIEQFRLPADALSLVQPNMPANSPRRYSKRFLKGPIPLDWLQAAAQLPGKALHVGIAIWFLIGLQKSSTVQLRPSLLRQFGIDRHAGYRALKALESESLITVTRQRGRSPMVTVVVSSGV